MLISTDVSLDPQLKALQLGCFRYFQCGGQCVDGPVGLLAGIIRRPLLLFYHFFSVALLSIWLVLSESPLYTMPLTLISSVSILYKACVVLSPFVLSELKN